MANDQNGHRRLNLNELDQGIANLSAIFGAACGEAAAVCLEGRGHAPGISMAVEGSYTDAYSLEWKQAAETATFTWNDMQVATEFGASAIAILLIRSLAGLVVVERSRKGTGFDYWVGPDDGLFQKKARLEISGIGEGGDPIMKARVQEKLKQVRSSDESGLSAYIIVVEFSRPKSRVVKK